MPTDSPVACLVGSNGTGKSLILEVIGAAAHRIGLSHGYASTRGDVFAESANAEVEFQIAEGVLPELEQLDAFPEDAKHYRPEWNRFLTVSASSTREAIIRAGGVPDVGQRILGLRIAEIIRRSTPVHYLILDADRAYPRLEVHAHLMGEALQTDWASQAKSRSFALTRNLYEEWFRYLIGTEGQENNKHVRDIRIARDRGEPDPHFIDKMAAYRDSIRSVLPHLLFTGIDSGTRQVLFDANGVPLDFDQLSGGEREIAFLVGQIERFGLRRGLLLVDEPELHLNNDLLRTWIGFLKGTVEQGQVWLASHSLEVVEVAGKDSTFALDRDPLTRKVSGAPPLGDQPLLTALSRAVGSPAFSISNLTIVLVEGEEEIGERERFRSLHPSAAQARFVESHSCTELVRRMEGLRQISRASGQPLKIGGIVDRDWRTAGEIKALQESGVHVLQVHEVENFFLHPESAKAAMAAISQDPSTYDDVLQSVADLRAGAWIFDAARSQPALKAFPPPAEATRGMVHRLSWANFSDIKATCDTIARSDLALTNEQQTELSRHLDVQARIYERIRSEPTLWKRCEGKEALKAVAQRLGFADGDIFERAVTGIWSKQPQLVPSELVSLRDYVNSVTA